MKYPQLFSPLKIGSMEVKNRVVMTAMGCSMANIDGSPSEQMISYYEERARGGVGLITTEITRVNDDTGVGESAQLSVSHNEVIPGLTKLADAIHKHDSKVFVQLHHPGRQTPRALINNKQAVSASDVTCQIIGEEPRALTTEEVYGIINDFVDGAWRAKYAGIDGVELHAAHGYLLNQFISPHTNKRTDEFGGSTEARCKIILDIIKGIRRVCGSDYPIAVRITVDEFLGEAGLELPEGIELCKMIEAAGVDMLNITSGIYETMNTVVEPISYSEGWRTHLAKAVKDVVSIPVCGNAVIRHPEFAEKLLVDGNQDLIGMGRPHLADPEWTNKAFNNQDDEINQCISCLRCFETVFTVSAFCVPIQCSVNPRLGREARYPYPKKDGNGRKVVIIGGGPAGLEAARVLANRRFKPVVFEANAALGGQLLQGSKPPKKEKLHWLADYYTTQMDKLGVEVHLNTKATVEDVKALDPYAVIVATGSTPIVPATIPGVDRDNVYTVPDILEEKVTLKDKKVAVIGSGMTGIEVSELIAEAGNEVSVVEMQETLTPDGYWQNVVDVMGRLQEYNANFLPSHTLKAITDEGIELDGETTSLDCDAVVLALGVRSENAQFDQFAEAFDRVYKAGDANQVGRIYTATTEGFVLGNKI
ncbi:FAD-dependent oxidoreductase [Enterococcus sp. 669A]|uniref:FAD-dependent oxidoreductase n=1 Tax=Candidatus Enterococcus moelleringii TaxID=2815325 RepID=A0ABS3LAP2_9ENTE|nr:NAD(P)/FAD-dependent oxidoreductase [Enterococcus sp. 669A]MBO1306108.1 FAD-dependent oxidoreductase [Enterococcus sp. 669A]